MWQTEGVLAITLGFLPDAEEFFRFLDISSVCVGGCMGGVVARQRRFDVVGFIMLAIMTALGGGMVRDMLLNTKPIAIWDPFYLPAALFGAGVAFVLPLNTKWRNRLLIAADAFVMGAWSGLGAVKALNFGTGVIPAILLGLLTGIGGSMIRDVCVGQIPSVFGGNYLYALPSMLASGAAVILGELGYPNAALVAATFVGAAIVILARWRHWRLPQTEGLVVSFNRQQLQALIRRAERHGRKQGRVREHEKLGELVQNVEEALVQAEEVVAKAEEAMHSASAPQREEGPAYYPQAASAYQQACQQQRPAPAADSSPAQPLQKGQKTQKAHPDSPQQPSS